MTKKLSLEEKKRRADALTERRAASAVVTAERLKARRASEDRRAAAAARSAAWRARMDQTPKGREERLAGVRAAQQAHYANPSNREKYLDSHYRRKFDIGLADVLDMRAAQSFVCAVCEEWLPDPRSYEKRVCVDHEHNTNPPKVRGLLCRECNLGLGHFRESPKALDRAAAYLRTSKV